MSNKRKTNDIASMQFYKFDKWLLMEEGLKKLSPTAKMLYMIIKDREELSLKNAKAFTDKDGYLFQYFDQQKASDLLGVSLTAIKKAFKAQTEGKGFSIIEVLSTCPTNWGLTPEAALQFVEDKMIPYYPLGFYKDKTKEA